MKKLTLPVIAAFLFLHMAAFAQSPVIPANVPQVKAGQNKRVKMKPWNFTGDEKIDISQTSSHNVNMGKPKTVRGITETTIGTTYYDIQTNAAISDRLWINPPDHTISAVWTFSPDAISGSPNRGTGYNYFNGAEWGPAPTTRIESQRTGWPNIALPSTGSEQVVAHNNTSQVMQHTYRPVAGSGPWTEDLNSLQSNATGGNLWSKTAANGNTVHVISLTLPIVNGGSLYNGINGAPLYYRSTNGGSTWDKTNVELPGITPQNYLGFAGDAYQIDAYGNTVAIVIGSINTDVILFKSTDNGETWVKTILLQHPFPLFDDNTITDTDNDGIADSVEVCDGALAVLVDNNEMVHVCWGDMFILNDVAGDGSTYFYPTVNSLIYWDETMAAPAAIPNLGALDLDGSGSLELPDDGSGIQIGSYSSTGLASFPSFGIDADNNIYMSYAAAVENTIDPDGKALRHTYVSSSTDNGHTWSNPVDVVSDPFSEGVYGCLSRTIDENLHLIYQKDFCAGTANIDPCNVGEQNDIVYVEMPASDFVCSVPTGLQVTAVSPNAVHLAWNDVADVQAYQLRYKMAGGSWQSIISYGPQKKIGNLIDDTHYNVEVRSKCSSSLSFSPWSEPIHFNTPPLRLSSMVEQLSMEVYPNPLTDNGTVHFNLTENTGVTISLYNLEGRFIKTIADGIYDAGDQLVQFSIGDLSPGIYVLHLKSGDQVYFLKVAKL